MTRAEALRRKSYIRRTQYPRFYEENYSLGTESPEESSEPFRKLSRAEIAERKLARMRDQTFKGFIFVKKGPDVADHITFFRQLIKDHRLMITEDQPIGITWGIDPDIDFSHPITGALAQMQVASIVGERKGFEVDYSRTKMNVIDDREYGEILLIEMYSK